MLDHPPEGLVRGRFLCELPAHRVVLGEQKLGRQSIRTRFKGSVSTRGAKENSHNGLGMPGFVQRPGMIVRITLWFKGFVSRKQLRPPFAGSEMR